MDTMTTEADQLATLIKRAATRSWCNTKPLTIAQYLLDHGVTLPTDHDDAHAPPEPKMRGRTT